MSKGSDKVLDGFAEMFLKKILEADGFNIKYKVNGASTIFKGREIWLRDWYSGFWGNPYDDLTIIAGKIEFAVGEIFKRIKELCPEKVVALGDVFVDITEHFDTKNKYYCVGVSFGGY